MQSINQSPASTITQRPEAIVEVRRPDKRGFSGSVGLVGAAYAFVRGEDLKFTWAAGYAVSEDIAKLFMIGHLRTTLRMPDECLPVWCKGLGILEHVEGRRRSGKPLRGWDVIEREEAARGRREWFQQRFKAVEEAPDVYREVKQLAKKALEVAEAHLDFLNSQREEHPDWFLPLIGHTNDLGLELDVAR